MQKGQSDKLPITNNLSVPDIFSNAKPIGDPQQQTALPKKGVLPYHLI